MTNLNPGIGNKPNEQGKKGTKGKIFFWRGKTYREPNEKQRQGIVVCICETGTNVFEANIWLYSATETTDKNNKTIYTLKRMEDYPKKPLEFRVKPKKKGPRERPEQGKNDDQNLTLDIVCKDQADVPAGKTRMRKILLTASRDREKEEDAQVRTVRFTTYTYDRTTPPANGGQDPDGSDGTGGGCGNSVKTSSTIPCSDYPDDAVLIETEFDMDYNSSTWQADLQAALDADTTWLDYPDWD